VRFAPLDKSLPPKERAKRFEDIVTNKGKDWEPESEYRWILPRDHCYWVGQPKESGEMRVINGRVKAFLPIPTAGIMKVTVGYYSSPSLLHTVLQLRARHHARWIVAKAKLSLERFTFEDEIYPA
jgi:hypothetical protein